MLAFWGPKKRSLCDRISRRNFLKVGALGGLTLADVLRLQAQAHGSNAPRPARKAVIMVNLQGGPSHLDTYDMKPDAPAEYRGEFRPIRTNVPGIELCELMPLQARIADKLAILRGVRFGMGAHYGHLVFTGFAREGVEVPERPAFGSVVSRVRGGGGDLPAYVSLNHAITSRFELPLYLGTAHRPFVPEGPALESLRLSPGLTLERLEDRKELLRTFDTLRRETDLRGDMAAMDVFTAQALELVTSNRARDAFDISREPLAIKESYNVKNRYSALFLQARRLVEAGVSVVTLTFTQDWDTHVDNFATLRRLLPQLDRNIHALVSDLHARGMDKDVLVVVWGEMGRTPRINEKAGRDHWGDAGIALLAGGGLRMGQVVGATNARGERSTGRPYTPQNVLATLYHVLGIDPALAFPDHSGRPVHLLDDRAKIAELV